MEALIKRIAVIVLLFSCIGCKSHLKTGEYIGFINNTKNGLKKEVMIDGWCYCFQYKPYDYIAIVENKGNTKADNFNKRLSELAGTVWFNISIRREDNTISPMRYGVHSIEEYNERQNYYLNQAQNEIRLVYGDKRIVPMSYAFENNYNLTPQETIVVGFLLPQGEDKPRQDMRISFVDKVFKNGIINAEYSSENLNNIPGVIY